MKQKCKHIWQFYVIPAGDVSYYDTTGYARDWRMRLKHQDAIEKARCAKCFKEKTLKNEVE